MNIEFPSYYRRTIKRWLKEEGFAEDHARDGTLYMEPAASSKHIVFALRELKGDRMVFALKMERHPKDSEFVVELIKLLCSKN